MPVISLIVAVDENNAIGFNGKLLCHLPADLAHFKKITTGHSIIMGRKTFDSLPNGALPNRRNIVITRNKNIEFENAEKADSLEKAIEMCKGEKEVFIIGGGEIYKPSINIANKIYQTLILHSFEKADTFFPKINNLKWKLLSSETHLPDKENRYGYMFKVYSSES